MQDVSGKVAVIGVGYSKVTRDPRQSLARDAVEACQNAAADAGLKIGAIDGVTTAAVAPFAHAGQADGIDVVTPNFLVPTLGLPDVAWSHRDPGLAGNSFVAAVNAVASGMCRYALVYRALTFPRGKRYGQVAEDDAGGEGQFYLPYGHSGAGPAGHAYIYRRYMDKYGARREHMATFIVNNRKNALLNDKGYWYNYRPEPLTVEEYLNGRMVADPFCIHDCDMPVHGVAAWVLTSADRAQAAPHPAAYVVGYAQGVGGVATAAAGGRLEQFQAVGRNLGERLWQNTGLRPRDIATLNTYDGFSLYVYLYLEALGFCKEGEAYQFIQGGRIALDGELPINTAGGNLGEGRLHGSTQITEAILQAMGRAGPRQVKNAHYTAWSIGMLGHGLTTAMVLSRERE